MSVCGRVTQSRSRAWSVSHVGVKHRESRDPHDQNTPSDNTLITHRYAHAHTSNANTPMFVNTVAVRHSHKQRFLSSDDEMTYSHIKISLLCFSLSLCEITQFQPLAQNIIQTLCLRCVFDMCNCMFSLGSCRLPLCAV